MSPLDTGSVVHTLRLVDPLQRPSPAVDDFSTVGEYLRAAREHAGVTLSELAAATFVRRAYLQALEDGRHDDLPSRPFAIGYARAAARALGLDEDVVAHRVKAEAPDKSGLPNPVGIAPQRPTLSPLVLVIAVIAVGGVVAWNVVQRQTSAGGPAEPPVVAPVAVEPPAVGSGPIALGVATPAPSEQTTPAPYVTPGLYGLSGPATAKVAPTSAVQVGARLPLPAAFATKQAIYGASAEGSTVLLQASKPASLIVRGEGGAVYFARQLAAGEAYRAPVGRKLTLEMAEPEAFGLYVAGRLQGALTTPLTPIDKAVAEVTARAAVLAPPAPAAARSSTPLDRTIAAATPASPSAQVIAAATPASPSAQVPAAQ